MAKRVSLRHHCAALEASFEASESAPAVDEILRISIGKLARMCKNKKNMVGLSWKWRGEARGVEFQGTSFSNVVVAYTDAFRAFISMGEISEI